MSSNLSISYVIDLFEHFSKYFDSLSRLAQSSLSKNKNFFIANHPFATLFFNAVFSLHCQQLFSTFFKIVSNFRSTLFDIFFISPLSTIFSKKFYFIFSFFPSQRSLLFCSTPRTLHLPRHTVKLFFKKFFIFFPNHSPSPFFCCLRLAKIF